MKTKNKNMPFEKKTHKKNWVAAFLFLHSASVTMSQTLTGSVCVVIGVLVCVWCSGAGSCEFTRYFLLCLKKKNVCLDVHISAKRDTVFSLTAVAVGTFKGRILCKGKKNLLMSKAFPFWLALVFCYFFPPLFKTCWKVLDKALVFSRGPSAGDKMCLLRSSEYLLYI